MDFLTKKTNLLAIALITVLTLSGCASAPVIEVLPFDKSATVEKSYDEVWSSLIRFLSTNDVSIATIEKESGLIALRGENLSRELITEYCAFKVPFLNSLSSGKATGSIVVVDDDGFVTVNANLRFQTTFVNTMANPPQYYTRECESHGAFETALLGSFQ